MEQRERHSRRRFIGLSASVMAGAALAACTPATPAPQPTQAPAQATQAPEATKASEPIAAPTAVPASGHVTIRWGMYGSPQWTPIFEEMFASFMSKYPNIIIAAEWAPFDVWTQRVQTQVAANTLPDITICDWDEFYDRIHAGVQIPLDEYSQGQCAQGQLVPRRHRAGYH